MSGGSGDKKYIEREKKKLDDVGTWTTLGVVGAYLIASLLFGNYYTTKAENYVTEVRVERDSANAQLSRIQKEISDLEAARKGKNKQSMEQIILSGQKTTKMAQVGRCDSTLRAAGQEIEKGKIFAKAASLGLAGFFID